MVESYYERNKKAILGGRKQYYKENKEKIIERQKKYLQSNRGKLFDNFRTWKKRGNRRKIITKFDKFEWSKKVEATNGICPNCHTFVGTENLTLDHIFPISKAEVDRIYMINDVQPLCLSCNSSKRDKNG